jgi:arabinose-5-phosphate isomerase
MVESGTRVSDVLDLFKARQISEIPVIDAEKRPLGIVDITDLLDLLPEAA